MPRPSMPRSAVPVTTSSMRYRGRPGVVRATGREAGALICLRPVWAIVDDEVYRLWPPIERPHRCAVCCVGDRQMDPRQVLQTPPHHRRDCQVETNKNLCGARPTSLGAAAAAAVQHNAHNLLTPKHGSRYCYGRRRGRHTTCYYTGR